MGFWATDSFGNDYACDWAVGLSEGGGLPFVEDTINGAAEKVRDELGLSNAAEIIAAVEVVARLLGNWGVQNGYSDDADLWVYRNPQRPPPSLIEKSHVALDAIASLADRWEAECRDEWLASIADLRSRLVNEVP